MPNENPAAKANDPSGDPLAAGKRVGGRYILKRVIGRGGMGVVWLARDVKLEQDVALKFVSETMLLDPNAIERLKRETRRSLQLTHPNIVRIYDFVQDHRVAAIAMEYVDGWSLWAMKVNKPQKRYSVEEITPWIRQLCSALDYAHTQVGIVHRDLKSANLMLNAREQLKVTDFGIARNLRGIGARDADAKLISGTDPYMSPQQAAGEEPSVLDDIYSLGATIYELLTSTPPFYDGDIRVQVREMVPPTMTERLHALAIDDNSIPLAWEQTVAACLAKDPAHRPQSVTEVLRSLEQPKEPAAKPSETHKQTRTAVSGKKLLWAAAAFAALIVVAGGTWYLAVHGKFSPSTWVKSATHTVSRFVDKMKPAAQLSKAGSLDDSFDPGKGTDGEIRSVIAQADGKILIGGAFSKFNDAGQKGIARLNADGSLDTAFLVSASGTVHTVAVQPDGNILIAGDFSRVNSEPRRTIGRLNADGSLDSTFNPAAGGNHEIRCVAFQPRGRVVVGGSFTFFQGKPRNRITRLNADGSRDAEFAPGAGADAVVWSVATQSDGKVLVVGDFARFNNKVVNRLVRLNFNGSIDTSFNPGSGANGPIFAVAVQADGKIVIGGDFVTINGVERNRVARLEADGSVDKAFNPRAGPNTGVRTLAVQPDGKVLIGGVFTSVQGVARNRIARLNADGSLDTGFDPGTGVNSVVRSVAIQPDGEVVIAGGFSEFNGVSRYRIARLHGGSLPITSAKSSAKN